MINNPANGYCPGVTWFFKMLESLVFLMNAPKNELPPVGSLVGKYVALMANDHLSSLNIDNADLDIIYSETSVVIVIGRVINEDEDKVYVASFFNQFKDQITYHDVHSILRKEVTDFDILEVKK